MGGIVGRAGWIVLIVLSCVFPYVSQAKELITVGHFSVLPQEGLLPEFWQPLEFKEVDVHTVYTHIMESGSGVLQAESRGGGSGLVRRVEIDPEVYPLISWQWKIRNSIEKADLTCKKGDDAPARIYITFAYDSSQVSWWEVVKFKTIKLFYGEYPPIGALMYVWASHVPEGTVLDSPYTSRARIIVLESGGGKKGKWVSERRNIRADYQRAFGTGDVPLISGVAIMTDTDNTGEAAAAWYGDISFSGQF
jgi:hypothetical protein